MLDVPLVGGYRLGIVIFCRGFAHGSELGLPL